jgi:hypothetical protein
VIRILEQHFVPFHISGGKAYRTQSALSIEAYGDESLPKERKDGTMAANALMDYLGY